MKKGTFIMLAALLLLCTACAAEAPAGTPAPAETPAPVETPAPAEICDIAWGYKDMTEISVLATGEDLEFLLWKFDVESTDGLLEAMKSDTYYSSTFSNMWFILHEDGTVEYARNGGPQTWYWCYAEGSTEQGYIASDKELFTDEERRLQFTVLDGGKELRLDTHEPYDADGDYQYKATYVLAEMS